MVKSWKVLSSYEGRLFKCDFEDLVESEVGSPAEMHEHAREYLRKLIGGVDKYFSEGYLDASCFGSKEIQVESRLYHEKISCRNAKTAEPSLEFRVELTFCKSEPFSRNFAWRLPETQSYRMAEELIEWAVDALTRDGENQIILPAFHIRYHEELMRAKDDDETKRVLLHAIRDVTAEYTNLITEDWMKHNDPMLPYLRDLAFLYKQFIDHANKNGLHSVFHKDSDNQPSSWEILRKAYEDAARAYLGEDDQCQDSPMIAMMMRAFLIVAPRDRQYNVWVADPFEKSGVVTVLHPALIEMLCDHIAYLFACFNFAASREWSKKEISKAFSQSMWQDYLDLAAIQMPLGGLISDENLILDTQAHGKELIHRIGSPAGVEAPLSTRLLLRYEGFEDESIADTEMFAETRESRLLLNILSDYLDVHPHARDGISLAFYWNKDIQPIITAIHEFLISLAKGDNPILYKERNQPYSVAITLFTEAGDDAGVERWIEQWKERWEQAESDEKFAAYRFCRFSVAHRVIPEQSIGRKAFARMINDALDVDIAVFYDFIGAGLKGNEFQRVEPYDIRERTLKFPIIEKSFCMVDNPLYKLKRARVISNPQFRLASLHLETMARLSSNATIPPKQEHALIGYGDFAPWQEVLDEAHKHVGWLVCIDPSIDDLLIKTRRNEPKKDREIIGFGSGVGLHGELNFTISTEQFWLSDIRYRLERAIAERYQYWDEEKLVKVAESLIKESQKLSGVSLIRATGVGTYIHDFMANCLAAKLLTDENDLLCNHLVTLDAYRHWFSKDAQRPDLLWLTASLDNNNRIVLDMHLIECKLSPHKDEYLAEAVEQIKSGLRTLIPAFMPRPRKGGDDVRPDQRYWWLQIHRLIASKTGISQQRQAVIMTAMERLADGDYSIAWHASVLAFMTDSDGSEIERIDDGLYEDPENGILRFGVYALGQSAVYRLCKEEEQLQLNWEDSPIRIDYFSESRETSQDQGDEESTGKEEERETTYKKGGTEAPAPSLEPTTAPGEGDLSSTTPIQTREIPQRILLGKSMSGGRDVYWEFGHRELPNRHLLVFGTSGMGKTYAIQCIICEMGRQQQNVFIMDYTNGFLPNQLEEETRTILDPYQHIVQQSPLPVSPFSLQVQEIGGGLNIPETAVSAAKRIAGTIDQIYSTVGDQQYAVLVDAAMELIEEHGDHATFESLLDVLESFVDDGRHIKNVVLSVISKLKPFILERPFADQESGMDWRGIFSDEEHRCHIFQFAGMDSLSARLVIEFTLWDLNAFVRGTGNKNLPKVVILDEAQNLDLSGQSPVAKYLTEGRKFGLSLILATQTMKNLQGDKLNRLFQAGHKLFFRPADTEIQDHAKLLALQNVGFTQQEWTSKLSSLSKGQCYSLGPSLNSTTGKLETKAFEIEITSLEKRLYFGEDPTSKP